MTLNGVYNSISWRHLAGLIYLHKKTIKYKLYIHDTRPHFTLLSSSRQLFQIQEEAQNYKL